LVSVVGLDVVRAAGGAVQVRVWLAMMTTIIALQGPSGHTAINAYLQQIIGDGG